LSIIEANEELYEKMEEIEDKRGATKQFGGSF
jgi:hypothetical protein